MLHSSPKKGTEQRAIQTQVIGILFREYAGELQKKLVSVGAPTTLTVTVRDAHQLCSADSEARNERINTFGARVRPMLARRAMALMQYTSTGDGGARFPATLVRTWNDPLLSRRRSGEALMSSGICGTRRWPGAGDFARRRQGQRRAGARRRGWPELAAALAASGESSCSGPHMGFSWASRRCDGLPELR